jgi:hypothetical protein
MMRRRARAATAGAVEDMVMGAFIRIYRPGNNDAERKLLMDPCRDHRFSAGNLIPTRASVTSAQYHHAVAGGLRIFDLRSPIGPIARRQSKIGN